MLERSLKKNALLNMIKTISSILFPLITFPYVSRVLMPENVGKVNFASSFISYFSLIASLGITTYAIRECSAKKKNKEELSKIASQIFSINMYTTLIAYILLILVLCFFKKFNSYKALIIIQSISILFTTLGCDWINTAMEDFTFITLRTIIFQIISLILMFVFVKGPNDFIKYTFILVFSSSGANIVNIFYRKRYCDIRILVNTEWRKHLKPIILLFVMILAQTIFSNADITMLGLMKGNIEVGIYSIALKIEIIIAQIVSSLAWVMMPRMSLYFEYSDYEKINMLLKNIFGILTFIGIPCIAGIIGISNEVVLLIGGEEYLRSAMPLSILMMSFGFSLLGGSFLGNMVLLPSKKEREYMIICCIMVIVNVVLNVLLIPKWGSVAAAGTTAFSSFLMMILMIISRDKKIKLNYVGKTLISPCLGSILIIIYCKFITLYYVSLTAKLIFSITGGMIIYILISFLLKNEILIEFINKLIMKRGKYNAK